MQLSKKTFFVAVGITAAVAIGGVAFAYFTSGGAGTGTATVGTAAAPVIVQTSVVTAMGPGIAAQALTGTVTSTTPAFVEQITPVVSSTTNVGCTSADFNIVLPTVTHVEVSTTPVAWSGGTIAFNNTAADQDACKGVTVTIGYTSN